MTLNKKSLFFYNFLWLVTVVLAVWGCAVQQKPQGGPRDRTPPKLLKATPLNKTHFFNAKQIRLDFDEYFKLYNPFQEITITPIGDKPPEFTYKQKTLIVDFKDSLKRNTTYVINFGAAIKDVNEGNTLKNFTYVFSTGSHIDSLSISGSVTDVLTQKKILLVNNEYITVMLFTLQDDSLLFGKKRPYIYTTVDTAGNFTLSNLKEGVYKIYALKEATPNRIYDNDKELIAFSKNSIRLQHDTAGIKLTLFTQIAPKFRFASRQFDSDGKMFFIFNKPLDKPSVRITYPPGLDEQKIVDFSKTRDTMMIYSKTMDFDSIKFALYDNNKLVDTTYLRKTRKENYTRNLVMRYGLSKNNSVIKPGADLHLYSNIPIETFDPALISLMQDSTQASYTVSRDTGANAKNFVIKSRWRQKSNYVLTLNEGAFTDIYGDKNKKQSVKFVQDKADEYSTLTLDVTVPDTSRSYIIELFSEQNVLLRSDRVSKKTTLVYRSLYTGRFHAKVVYDDNKNGKWDSGNLKDKIQPENIWVYDKTFALRPNWEVTEPLDIPKEVIAP